MKHLTLRSRVLISESISLRNMNWIPGCISFESRSDTDIMICNPSEGIDGVSDIFKTLPCHLVNIGIMAGNLLKPPAVSSNTVY
jgi:hypothetical protein